MITRIQGLYNRIRNNKLLSKGLVDTQFYFLANLGTKVINFLIVPIITRLVGVEQFALYDLFLLYSGILSMVAGLGMDSGSAIIIAENQTDKNKLGAVFTQSLMANLIMLGILWAAMAIYLQFGRIPMMNEQTVHLIFLYSLFYQISYLVFSFIRWMGDSKTASILHLISSVGGTVLGFVFLYTSKDKAIGTFLYGLIIGNGVGALISMLFSWRYVSFAGLNDGKLFSELWRLSLPFVPTYAASYLMQVIDRFIVSYFFGAHGLGLYALTTRIAQIPNVILQIVNKGFQPVVYANYQTESGMPLGRQLFNGYVLAIIPVSIAAIGLARYLVIFFGGEGFIEAVPILPAVVVSIVVYGAIYLDGYGFTIKRKTHYITYIMAGSLVATALLGALAAQFWGLFGVAFATLLSSMVSVFVYCSVSERLYAFRYNLNRMAGVFIVTLMLIGLNYLV